MASNFAQYTTVAEEMAFIAEEKEAVAQAVAQAQAEKDEMRLEYWAKKDAEAQAMAQADRLAWYTGQKPEAVSIYDMSDWEYRQYERELGI